MSSRPNQLLAHGVGRALMLAAGTRHAVGEGELGAQIAVDAVERQRHAREHTAHAGGAGRIGEPRIAVAAFA